MTLWPMPPTVLPAQWVPIEHLGSIILAGSLLDYPD